MRSNSSRPFTYSVDLRKFYLSESPNLSIFGIRLISHDQNYFFWYQEKNVAIGDFMDPDQFKEFDDEVHLPIGFNWDEQGIHNIPKAVWKDRLIAALSSVRLQSQERPAIQNTLLNMYAEKKKTHALFTSKEKTIEDVKKAVERLCVMSLLGIGQDRSVDLIPRRKKLLDNLGLLQKILSKPAESQKKMYLAQAKICKDKAQKFFSKLDPIEQAALRDLVKDDLDLLEKYHKKMKE
jgi:hypothetical protein